MVEVNDFNVICKEVLTILSCSDKNIINKIPDSLIKELAKNAADAKNDCVIDPQKGIEEQNILEESKDFLALIYYSFIANEDEKEEIKKEWDANEKKYQEELNNKYNVDRIFKNRSDNNKTMALIEYKEENIFIKIIKKILNKFNK